MTPPIWLDAQGRRHPTRACWTCGREVAPMRFRASDLRPHGWAPPQTLHIPDWCGCTTDGPRITFRTIPARLHAWLRRIDRWIAYANSVVEE